MCPRGTADLGKAGTGGFHGTQLSSSLFSPPCTYSSSHEIFQVAEADLLPGPKLGLFTVIITESWSCFIWKEPWEVSRPNLLLKTGSTINSFLVSWGFTQSGVENLQGQRPHGVWAMLLLPLAFMSILEPAPFPICLGFGWKTGAWGLSGGTGTA